MDLGLIVAAFYVLFVLAVTIFLIVLAWRFVVAHEQMTVASKRWRGIF